MPLYELRIQKHLIIQPNSPLKHIATPLFQCLQQERHRRVTLNCQPWVSTAALKSLCESRELYIMHGHELAQFGIFSQRTLLRQQ